MIGAHTIYCAVNHNFIGERNGIFIKMQAINLKNPNDSNIQDYPY